MPLGNEAVHEYMSLEKGQVIKDFRLLFRGKPVTNVMMELTALGTDYMVAGSVRSATGRDISALQMGNWKLLDLESDVLQFGEVIC